MRKYMAIFLATLFVLAAIQLPCTANESAHTLIDFKFLEYGIELDEIYKTVGQPDEVYRNCVRYQIENGLTLELYADDERKLEKVDLISEDGICMHVQFGVSGEIRISVPSSFKTKSYKDLVANATHDLSEFTFLRRGIRYETIVDMVGEKESIADSIYISWIYALKGGKLIALNWGGSDRLFKISIETEDARIWITFEEDESTGRLLYNSDDDGLERFSFLECGMSMDEVYSVAGAPDRHTLLGDVYELGNGKHLVLMSDSGELEKMAIRYPDGEYVFFSFPPYSNGPIFLEDGEIEKIMKNGPYKRGLRDFRFISKDMGKNEVEERLGQADFCFSQDNCYMLGNGEVLSLFYRDDKVVSAYIRTRSDIKIMIDYTSDGFLAL